MKWYAAGVILIWLVLGGNYFYWKLYWTIREDAFSQGVEVGIVMARCGLPSIQADPRMAAYLSHFVKGDDATHNCELLRQEEDNYYPQLTPAQP